jgi:hypothetical protein
MLHRAPSRRLARLPRVGGLIALGLCTAAACRGARDAAAEERAREEQEVRRLAEQAGRMASDGEAAGRPGTGISVGDSDGSRLVHGDDPPLGPGDVRVVSTDGALVLAVIGDTVRARLGDSVVRKVEREMAAKADTSGFGGFVARTVKGAVSGAMSAASHFALRVPVADVRDLKYRDGQLRFRTGANGTTSARLDPDDAERFIAAVRARQQRPSGR